MKKISLVILFIGFAETMVLAQTSKNYHLFNPVPREKMRDMSTDRPDVTESPISVDAGHFQIETDLFKTSKNKTEGITSVENNFNLANLKLGITQNMDFQLIVGNYVSTYIKSASGVKIDESEGLGDLTFRVKYNFWGNDGGKTAFAMMPYINVPTSKESKYWEPGIVFPFSVDLGNEFSLGSQLQVDLLKSVAKTGYHASVLQSLVVGKELTDQLEAFGESYYVYDFEEKKTQVSVNGGLGFSITPNVKFDAGFNLGLTKNTDKVYFIGFSFRY